MRRGSVGIAALLVGAFVSMASPLHAGTVLVLSQTAAKLTALDSDTHAVRGSLALEAGPANIAVSPDGQHAYVAHSDLGEISVIDLPAWRVASKFKAPGSPFGLVLGGDGRLYVGDWNGESIHELNGTEGTALRSAKVGKAPAHLALTPDGATLLAVAREANTVAVIDTASLQARAILTVERAPFALAVAPDGTHALVANAQAGSVSRIDVPGAKVSGATRVGAMPYGVAFTPAGDAVVTNQQSGTVSLLPAAAGGTASTIRVGSYPEGLAVSSDGASAYAANWFSDDLSVIDLKSGKESSRIKLPAGPRAVVVVSGSFGR